MSQIDDSNHEDEFPVDDFHLDEELNEIQSQLESDAQHLQSLYPPMNSSRLDQLVDQCLLAASQAKDAYVQTGRKHPSRLQSDDSAQPARRWFQIPMEICISLLLVVSFGYLWIQPGVESKRHSIVSNRTDTEVVVVPAAMSVSTMPPELLNASQPELEAIYDEMGMLSMSVEF